MSGRPREDPTGEEPTREERGATTRVERPVSARGREAPTRALPLAGRAEEHDDPRRPRAPWRTGWTALILAAACGFLLGLLVLTTLGGTDTTTDTVTRSVTVQGTVAAAPGGAPTVITRTLIPSLVGQPLDVAKDRAKDRKFSITVDSGGGTFGVIRDSNWEIVAQRPAANTLIEQGSTIHVDIVKR